MSSSVLPGVGRRPWRVFACGGMAATALYLLNLSSAINGATLVALGIGTVWACFAGPRRLGAEPRAAWLLIGLAALSFLVGVLIRPLVTDLAQPLPLLADLATIPGYVLLCVFLIILLRSRQSLERHAVLDGLIVCLAGGLATVLLLAAPAVAIDGRPGIESVLAGLYPLFDVTVLLLVVNLTFTTTTWPLSLVTLLGTMTSLFIGDTAYAIIGVTGRIYASPLLNVPFLMAYTLLGVTALHPSVVELSRAARPPVQAWSGRRIALLVPALATPFVLLLVNGGHSAGYRLIIAVAGLLCVVLLMLRAVTAVQAQVAAQRQSEHQAMHDPLTGLPNRRMITMDIEAQLRRLVPGGPGRVWVYLLDLDRFKWVNDSWGHDAGDQLVIEVGARLRAAAPPTVRVARVGGDEFALAYIGDEAGAMRLAEAIHGCFARPLPVRGTEVAISTSIGLAHAGGDPGRAEAVAEAMMRDADTAMYRAKGTGPGRFTVFDRSMHDQVRERIELEVALRQALGDGQFSVAYQPIVRLQTGQPLGAEALIRWVHPDRGQVPPAVFIPIAEDAGLIGAIGDWVRREALRQLGEWRTAGVVADDFYLSINVSPRQLTEAELPLIVSAELVQFHVPARCVALEMTESVMVDGSSVTARVLFELRELGVKLLIDDFGTGFSALGYLRRFPVTGVKIDRSFVTDMGVSAEDDAIVRAVVAMSFALGLSVIAEGVETRLQRDALGAVGVTNGQGWLWGPAVPAAEFARHWHTTGMAALANGRHRRD
ncbi:putative bifunctional diguanylate cyclase/phosphodiesterase [Micromonosporaceae bacterium Da 78-11]